MPSTPSYAPGWGPLKVEDRRLKGWEPLVSAAPIGSAFEVRRAARRISNQNGFQEIVLEVTVRFHWPDQTAFDRVFLLRKADRVSLFDLGQVAAYLNELGAVLPPANDLPHALDRLESEALDAAPPLDGGDPPPLPTYRAGDGPAANSLEILELFDAVKAWRDLGLQQLERSQFAETVLIEKGVLEWALFAAFRAGRVARGIELSGDMARQRTASKALKGAEDAKAWWRAGAEWAQHLVDNWPLETRFSRNRLAERMRDLWKERPFRPKGPARVDQLDLARRVLPMWEAEGWLRPPKR